MISATPKPFLGTTRGEENLIPQSIETGQVVPVGNNGTATAVTKDGPKVKPWAHFVAGGYAFVGTPRSGRNRLTMPQPWWYDRSHPHLSSRRPQNPTTVRLLPVAIKTAPCPASPTAQTHRHLHSSSCLLSSGRNGPTPQLHISARRVPCALPWSRRKLGWRGAGTQHQLFRVREWKENIQQLPKPGRTRECLERSSLSCGYGRNRYGYRHKPYMGCQDQTTVGQEQREP